MAAFKVQPITEEWRSCLEPWFMVAPGGFIFMICVYLNW